MNNSWLNEFRSRLKEFESKNPPANCLTVSFKIRVSSGCFHREHSPHAYRIIDGYLAGADLSDVQHRIDEHESGPELLF